MESDLVHLNKKVEPTHSRCSNRNIISAIKYTTSVKTIILNLLVNNPEES
jgi:hypothetical protein